jgi:hypothetical protein
MTLTFTRERETKNTVRFQEQVAENDAAVIGTLYIQKHAAKGAQTVTVTLAFAD